MPKVRHRVRSNSNSRWLDTTPVSRIIARCTGDINNGSSHLLFFVAHPPIFSAVDTRIPSSFEGLAVLGLKMFTQMVALVVYTPVFILPAVVLTGLGKWCGDLFARAVLCVRREL